MMKRILLALFLATAQNGFCHRYQGNKNPAEVLPRNEVSVSYGLYSVYDVLDGIEPGLHMQDCSAEFESTPKEKTGSISIEYSGALSEKVRLGVIACYTGYIHEVQAGHEHNNIYIGDLESRFFGLLPKVQLYWFNHEHAAMYSKFAIGAALNTREMTTLHSELHSSIDENRIKLELQLSPFCLEVGSSQLRGFAELGIGNYLFSIGMKYYWGKDY